MVLLFFLPSCLPLVLVLGHPDFGEDEGHLERLVSTVFSSETNSVPFSPFVSGRVDNVKGIAFSVERWRPFALWFRLVGLSISVESNSTFKPLLTWGREPPRDVARGSIHTAVSHSCLSIGFGNRLGFFAELPQPFGFSGLIMQQPFCEDFDHELVSTASAKSRFSSSSVKSFLLFKLLEPKPACLFVICWSSANPEVHILRFMSKSIILPQSLAALNMIK